MQQIAPVFLCFQGNMPPYRFNNFRRLMYIHTPITPVYNSPNKLASFFVDFAMNIELIEAIFTLKFD